MKIMSFTRPHVVANLFRFFCGTQKMMSSRMNASVIFTFIVWTKDAVKVNDILHNICFYVPQKKVIQFETTWGWVIILVNNLFNVYVAFQISTCVHTKVLRPRVSDFGRSFPSGQILVGLFSVRLVFNFILAINIINFSSSGSATGDASSSSASSSAPGELLLILSAFTSFCPVSPKLFT